jgi:hypothetical protein
LWTGLLALAVFYYVVFDGFDLGVGILYGFQADETRRNMMMASIAPVWDGNETSHLRRRRTAGGISARIRDHHPGRLFSDPADAAGAGVPRRRLRIPLQASRRQAILGSRVLRRLDGRDFKVDGRHFAGTSFDWITPFAPRPITESVPSSRRRGIWRWCHRDAARPDHAPADAQQRQAALHRPIEGARHFGDEIGKIDLDVGRRRRRGVGSEPDHDRAFLADVVGGDPG